VTDDASRVLVLVTGAARSGTSAAAGVLHHLGLDVPGPFLNANESNPKGFYESRWAVKFHNRLIAAAGVSQVDGRPEAFDRIQAVVDDSTRAHLTGFLARHQEAPQLVVKDPRSVWVQQLWRDAAAGADREVRYLTMLRHPAEVVSSRITYYAGYPGAASATEPRERASLNLMRWINLSLVGERETRGERRSFVEYADLLADWRPTMIRVASELGVVYDPSADVRPHPVDQFLDPELRRHEPSWAEVPVPDLLREIAEETWAHQSTLATREGSDADAEAGLDRLAERYRQLVDEAHLVSQEAQQEAVRVARAAGAHEESQEPRDAPVSGSGVEARAVADVRSRDLLRVVRRRLLSRKP
jgi:hypothetical protein